MENKLRAYMDHLFQDVPNTKKAVEVKEEILQNIVDKYHDLVAEGKSEEAAYNIAIASIGDLDELLASLKDSSQTPNQIDSENYMAWRKKSAIRISVAIMLYILCVTPPIITDSLHLPDAIARWTKKVDSGEMGIPVDGLVITYDDTDYAATGSVTGHHATRAGLAYKWADVSAETVLDHIEWSCAASTITPVAVFDPVQLEGTTVSRASLCNVSELERLGIGADRKTTLRVIKANKIIPKCIAVVRAEGSYEVPSACPVCGAATEVRVSPVSGVKTLRCTDANCPAKHLKRFVRFASKAGLDIDGLSVQTLHEFVNRGYLRDFSDLYHLNDHAGEIVALEGFGEKSCANLMAAIEKSRKADPVHLIFALCIPNIGTDAGKKLIAALGTKGFLARIESGEGFEDVDGIGVERSNALLHWFADEGNRALFERLMHELLVDEVAPKVANDGTCKGFTFVITGDVHTFKNRDDFKAYVERQGGKVAGSVSGKTSYLVSTDGESGSSKAKKAKELGVPVLSEEAFISRFGGPDGETNAAPADDQQISMESLL